MNLFVSTCVVLLVILAGMHYMAKVKSENLGPFFKWIGYLVLLAAACMLFALMFKGVKKAMRVGRGGPAKEAVYMNPGKQGAKARMGARGKTMNCGGMNMGGCGTGGNMQHGGCCCCCGDMGMMGDGPSCTHMRSETTVDTVDGKIIRKEMEIIEKDK